MCSNEKTAYEKSIKYRGDRDTRVQNFVQCCGRWPSSRPLNSTVVLSPLSLRYSFTFSELVSRRVSSSEPIVAKPPSNDPRAPLNNSTPWGSILHPQFRKSTFIYTSESYFSLVYDIDICYMIIWKRKRANIGCNFPIDASVTLVRLDFIFANNTPSIMLVDRWRINDSLRTDRKNLIYSIELSLASFARRASHLRFAALSKRERSNRMY